MLAAAGCQSGDNGILNLGSARRTDGATAAPGSKVLASQLQAYCRDVTVRDGTAFFNTYGKDVQKAKPKLKKTGDAAQDAAAQPRLTPPLVLRPTIRRGSFIRPRSAT